MLNNIEDVIAIKGSIDSLNKIYKLLKIEDEIIEGIFT